VLASVYRIHLALAVAGVAWTACGLWRGVPPHPLAGALVLWAVLVFLYGTSFRLAMRFRLGPEARRKFLHVSTGLALAAGPVLFQSAIPLVVSVALLELWFGLLRYSVTVRRRLGAVLYGVRRQDSLGDLLFPLGFLAVYLLSGGRGALFWAPLLALTLADAAAALVGTRLGKHPFLLWRAKKTLEGTAAFFLVSFSTTALVLLASSSLEGAGAAQVAIIFAVALSAVEALSSRGWDNLLVPLAGVAVLASVMQPQGIERGILAAWAAAGAVVPALVWIGGRR
jgi:phytol kinase